jgi:hypothetical protein
MLRITHKLRCFLWRQNNPEVNYCPTRHNKAVYQLFIDFKKAYDSVRREALYNILVEFGIPRNW